MIEEADRDGSGSIEFQEFLMLMDKAEKDKWTKKELKQVFTVFDKVKQAVQLCGDLMIFQDGNGYVSTSELKFVMTRLNVYFSEDELSEMVGSKDKFFIYCLSWCWSTRQILMETHKSALKSFMTSCARRACKCLDPHLSDLFHSIKT